MLKRRYEDPQNPSWAIELEKFFNNIGEKLKALQIERSENNKYPVLKRQLEEKEQQIGELRVKIDALHNHNQLLQSHINSDQAALIEFITQFHNAAIQQQEHDLELTPALQQQVSKSPPPSPPLSPSSYKGNLTQLLSDYKALQQRCRELVQAANGAHQKVRFLRLPRSCLTKPNL